MYSERPSSVRGAVVWTSVVDGGETRILPDGCIDIIWNDGALFVAGPDTVAHSWTGIGGTSMTGLRFAPGTAPTALGVPAVELRDRRVPASDLLGARLVRSLSDELGTSTDPGGVLERFAHGRLASASASVAASHMIVHELRRGATVDRIADATGQSVRHLHRRCLVAFGYGPKLLAKILRLQEALELARSGMQFAQTAACAGYADQAHMARDVRSLTGVAMGELIR